MFAMKQGSLRAVLCGLLMAQMATPCQAGLFDRLFGKKQPTTQIVCCQPATCCNTCSVNRTVVNYAPQTVYTTSWVRVPVTTYRPISTTDPTTCCRVNYMQPSTSYVWQARRKPHVIYKPFLSRVANACATCNAGGAMPQYAAPPGVGAVSQPGATGNMIAAPGAAPEGYSGSTYPPSPYNAPGATGAPSAGAMTPADQRPSLDPNLPVTPQSTQRPSLADPAAAYGTHGGYSTSPYGQSTAEPPVGSGVPPSVGEPTPAPGPPRASTKPLDSSITTKRPAPEAPQLMTPPKSDSNQRNGNGEHKQGAKPNPVLDPEASNRQPAPAPSSNAPPVPRLLNPSDRTASLRPRIAVPVSWARVRPAVFSASSHREAESVTDDVRQPARPKPLPNPSSQRRQTTTGQPTTQPSPSRPMEPVQLPRKRAVRTISPKMAPVRLP